MQATAETVRPKFKGSADQKEVAEKVFGLVSATARFFSATSPISVRLSAIADHLETADGTKVDSIDAALKANDHIFIRQEQDDEVIFLTTRTGMLPELESVEDADHTFAARFSEPLPTPSNYPARRTAIADDEGFGTYSDDGVTSDDTFTDQPLDESEAVPQDEPEASAAPAAADVETVADLNDATDEEIVQALRDQLAYDYAVANFGDEWMAEDKVPRLSRGDLRRIKDYVAEQGGPVSDHQIVQDLLGIRQNAQEYPLHVFSVNFRLSRETRDFEFVGIAGAHFWTTSGTSTPDVANRKASEVGQDYRVLIDLNDEPSIIDAGVVEHVLTFYEHRHGVLPYDATFQSIISGAVLPGQRSAIVTFESPLTNQTFPIEVRFPTGNRGGYLAGFAAFFKEHLVPGAFVTIEAGETPGHYTIEFLTVSGQDRKLLTIDEKKQQYKFDTVTFYCAPNEDMLVSENRFPKLAGTSPLDDRVRRQPAQVLEHAFAYAGERVDSSSEQLMAVMDEIVAAANVERPMPAALIRNLAASDKYPQFTIDPEADDVVYFTPGSSNESTD
ncbi:MAG: hypothetical protein EA415_14965 [Sphaerobacteraceae bacterium]|nr:MAG: hypothetical protein EA415_14965 [Sphaerobacteraceae bacterium]